VAVNWAAVVLAGTVTPEGTVTAALLLDKFTTWPPLGAGELKVAVQASVPVPVIEALVHESDASELVPFPCSRTIAEGADELLATVNWPSDEPAEDGSNLRLTPTEPPLGTRTGSATSPSSVNDPPETCS
jgi:hypothetical protein